MQTEVSSPGIEGKHDPLAALLGEPEVALPGPRLLEVRCLVAHVQFCHRSQPSTVAFWITTGATGGLRMHRRGRRGPRSSRPCLKPSVTVPTSAKSGGRPASASRGDDEELAARGPGRLGVGLRHRDRAARVGEVAGRLLGDREAGAARAGALRIAALDHEAGDDPVERRAVEGALLGQVLERGGRLRRPLGVERDREAAAVGVDHDGRRGRLGRLRPGQIDVLRLGAARPSRTRRRRRRVAPSPSSSPPLSSRASRDHDHHRREDHAPRRLPSRRGACCAAASPSESGAGA